MAGVRTKSSRLMADGSLGRHTDLTESLEGGCRLDWACEEGAASMMVVVERCRV
jgi:hypothetical protein